VIFVTIGSVQAFDRLVRAVDRLPGGEEIVVQHGPSPRPRRGRAFDFLSHDDVARYMASARVIVTHAGVGSILAALSVGKRPVVVPRRSALGEAVDDHQVELARHLHRQGTVWLVEEVTELPAALTAYSASSTSIVTGGALADELRAYVEHRVAHPRSSRRWARPRRSR
jgi:UDP-N-acetylglucosamine transferase subunit ALG13